MFFEENYFKNILDVYIVWLGENILEIVLKIVEFLRDNDIKVYIDYLEKGMKFYMKKVDKLEIRYCVIFGEDEFNKGIVLLKDFFIRE